ncbi:MAG: heavy-metal-associated domain-containing protein [Pseudobdellovibrionaceae bacterium]
MKSFILSIVTLLVFAATPALANHGAGGTVKVDVNGLVCDFCARSIEKVFKEQPAVEGVNVDLDTKVVTIDIKDGQMLDDAVTQKLITDAGYDVVAIHHEGALAQ